MLFYGSVCAVVVSALMYRGSRKGWPLVFEKFLYEVKYNLLAMREMISDWIHAKYNDSVNPPQTGRVAIVTGGSRGIGVKVVQMLLELDMEVIIACRTPSAGDKVIHQIRECGIQTGQAKVYALDNASLKSVKHFAEEMKKNYKQIHVLINNAGVMFCPYEITEDGFEMHWAINYLSTFLLTSLLMPLLKSGGLPNKCSRIVNVTSCAHLLGKINFSDTNSRNKYITEAAYAQSKLAQEVFTKKLQDLLTKREYNVQVYSVHPGLVMTDLFVHSRIWKLRSLMGLFFKTPEQGAIPIVYTAVNEALEKCGGVYISNNMPGRVHKDSFDPSIQEKLFELSLKEVQLNDFFQDV